MTVRKEPSHELDRRLLLRHCLHPPPDRCPTCDTPLPDFSRNHPIEAVEPSVEVVLEDVPRVASIRLGGQASRPAKRTSSVLA
jgi:uncharacterized protein with PIN domain